MPNNLQLNYIALCVVVYHVLMVVKIYMNIKAGAWSKMRRKKMIEMQICCEARAQKIESIRV